MDFIDNREGGLLEAIGREFISGNRDINDLLQNVFNIVKSYYSIERGMISIYYKDEDEISVDINYGYSGEEMERGVYRPDGIIGTVVQTGNPVVIPDIRNEPRFTNRAGSNRNAFTNRISFICIPVIIERTVIGAISVEIMNNSGRDLADELHMLATISIMISQAVNNRMELVSREKYVDPGIHDPVRLKLTQKPDSGKPCISGTLEEMTDRFQREIIMESLRLSGGNMSRAAKNLGTTKRILGYKMSKLGIDYRIFRSTDEDS